MIPTPPTSPHSSSSPTFQGPPPATTAAASPRTDKRASASIAAAAYPTPPPSSTPYQHAQFNAGRHAHMPSIQGQLEIPPYNPNKRRQSAQTGQEQASSPTGPPATRRPQAARPASVNVYPTHATGETSSQSSGSRNRASVASTIPAAYAGRQRVFFGPYLLLQTLGEGEFGKVKLGTHLDRPGEEVAIKLIKRGAVQDSQARMAKIAREIDVLKAVKHPNIVRLHNVIETEKYIGIVLEYASGGELFDHILAHRYLKEKDACKLFAQLISGVSYLHGKKIVHRDLKLENLLLDRNRNIIITDFGFANRYHDKADDLMSTSCGSPCYAAPELVVQDGKYVGSAVDVWSCGVILYAMLAGYLPFDDDPNNPEGDNINMLYRYIINTPLVFPEWVSQEPRDLLHRMLVPDPLKRCTLADVAQHSWLRRYREVFTKTVDELEAIADAQDRRKAELIEQRRQAAAVDQASASALARSQSSSTAPRHQSAMIPVSATAADLSGPPAANTRSGRRGQVTSAIVTSATPETDAFNFVPGLTASPVEAQPTSLPMATTSSAPGRTTLPTEEPLLPPAASTRSAEAKRRKAANAAHRYTVQVEYDPGTSSYSHSSKDKGKGRAVEPDLMEETPAEAAEPSIPTIPLVETVSAPPAIAEHVETPEEAMIVDAPPVETAFAETPTEEEAPGTSPVADEDTTLTNVAKAIEQANAAPLITHDPPTPQRAPSVKAATPQSASPKQAASVSTPPAKPASPKTPSKRSSPVQSTQPFPSPERERTKEALAPVAITPSRIPKSSTTSAVSSLSSSSTARPDALAASTRATRHKKGMSTDNKFLNRLLGSSTSQLSIDKTAASASTSSVNAPATTRARRSSTIQTEASDETEKKSNRRRKALSMMVEPFSGPPKRKTRQSELSASRPPPAASDGARTRSATASQAKPVATAHVAAAAPARVPAPGQSPRKTKLPQPTERFANPPVLSGPGPSKAKRVMDWFRWRSLSRDTAVNEAVQPPVVADIAPLAFTEPAVEAVAPIEPTPTVVVTNPADAEEEPQSVPSSRSASGAHSEASDAPTATTVATSVTAPSPKLATQPVMPSGASIASSTAASVVEPFNERQLRFHNGAVDQNALTSRPPPGVIADIKRVLWEMGIDAKEEAGPYRLRCMRPNAKRVPLTISTSHGSVGSGLAGTSPSITGLSASPSTTFKAFFNRRNSSTSSPQSSAHGHGSSLPSPALTASTMTFDSPSMDANAPLPKVGPAAPVTWIGADDSGGEVRFSVEMAKIKGLNNLYSVDLRRLKGSLFEYRAIYLEVLNRLELSS